MTSGERARTELLERLDEAVGPDAADTLMGYLPPVGWADVATKADLDHLRAATKADLLLFRTELRADMDELRTEIRADMGDLRTEIRADMDNLRTGTAKELAALRSDLSEQMLGMEVRFERALRHTMLAVLMAMMASVGAAVGISQLLA